MGRGNRMWMGALALAGAGWLVLALPPAPAAADPLWSFEPSSANVGDLVTLSGTGWTYGSDAVWIFLPGAEVNDPNSEPWRTATVLEDGSFRLEEVPVPPVIGGSQSFSACQKCAFVGGPDPPPFGRANLYISADLRFDVDEGLPETVIEVTGSGWKPGDGPVTLFASEQDSTNPDNLLVRYRLQDNGTLAPNSTFTVPPYDAETYTFFACQLCGLGEKTWSAEVPFEITAEAPETFDPDLDFGVNKAMVGQEVDVEGHGWSDAAGDVFVYADASDIRNDRPPLVREGVEGGAFSTTIEVPKTEEGALAIFACQVCGTRPDLEVTKSLDIVPVTKVVPRLNLLSSSGSPGAEFRTTGTGWGAGDVRLFARKGSAKQKLLGSAPTTNGSFEATLKVPDMGLGLIDVVACQRCGTTEQLEDVKSFTVVKDKQDGPALTVEPRAVRSGERVSVSGAGWSTEDGEVTVYLEPAGTNELETDWFRVTPEPDGTFAREVDAPDRETGNYKVVACQRCDESPGNPHASRALAINGGGPNLLLVVMVAAAFLLAAAFVVWQRLRGPRTATDQAVTEDDPEGGTPLEAPAVDVHADATFDAQLREPVGGAVDVEVPSLDVVAHPDPARLADQLEVTT